MEEENAKSEIQYNLEHDAEKRRYEKPCIAEEESYETCTTLACALKEGVFKCRSNPTNS